VGPKLITVVNESNRKQIVMTEISA